MAALSVLIIVAFYPVLSADFINYDDPLYVTANRHIGSGITPTSIAWAFTTFYFYNWHPLTWLSHMLDVQLFGLNPMGHHAVNLVFHLANTLVLFALLKKMTGSLGKSFCVAALFAVHPLHVQSVAWIAERKDVLSTLFWFLVMFVYSDYARRPRLGAYFLCMILFIFGLMAKPMLVTLPFVLLLMDYWPLRRFNPPMHDDQESTAFPHTSPRLFLLLEKLPLLGLSLASSIITYLAQEHGGALSQASSAYRADMGIAVSGYLKYVGKMLWPTGLSVFYPYDPAAVAPWQGIAAVIIIIILSALVIIAARRLPYLPVGWFWYLGTLVPVIGIVKIGEQAMADRYTYVPLIGLFIVIVWGGSALLERLNIPKLATTALVAVMLLCCTVLANLQSRTWHDSITLFTRALQVTENNWIAHKNLAAALAKKGDFATALLHTTESLRIKPEPLEYVSQGWLYYKLGNFEKAVEACRNSLAMMPTNDKAHFILGLSYISLEDARSALNEYSVLKYGQSAYADQLLGYLNRAGIAVPGT